MLKHLRNSVLLKVVGLLILMLLMAIPLSQVGSLNAERRNSQSEAAEELANTYAGSQTVIGPLLVVPYVERWQTPVLNARGKVIGQETHSKPMVELVFPERLNVEGTLTPQERYRGIFKVLFYTLEGNLSGNFAAFNPSLLRRSEEKSTVEAGTPYVAFNVSDLRGLDGSPTLRMGETTLRFERRTPGLSDNAWLADGIHAPLTDAALTAWRAGSALPFDLQLTLVGQENLALVPIGEETTGHLSSTWAHPSFGGHFLANQRNITAQGFDAQWRISSLVSTAREQIRSGGERSSSALQSFDVSLAQPLNVYAMSTRATKYGQLFIVLVLMAAFMFELFRKLRLHPVQYGLVGLSIALFFLLLLALSEKMAFWLAYASAASASVLLLATYFSGILGGWKRGASFGAYVALLYGALYGLLASESNALLLGALLIFGMLGLLMLATRKTDWYALSEPAKESGGA